jgi:hypothetical protein
MGMNGKTIGRMKPAPDMTQVNDIAAAEEQVASGAAAALTPLERAYRMENIDLKRQLAVANARVAVMTMGGDKDKMFKPVAGAFERMAAFEAVVLSTVDMNDAARLRTLAKMADDVKSFAERREKNAAEVESNVADKLAKGWK